MAPHGYNRGGSPEAGALIRERRVQAELTRASLARLVGCHYRTLQKIEEGRRGASEVMLQRIARALECDRKELMLQDAA